MKRVLTVVAFAFGLALLTANTASSHNWGFLVYKHIEIKPFHFGIGAASGWIRGAGEPKAWFDPQQWGFLMQKHAPTTSYAAGGADITGVPKYATGLSTLSFDISGVVGESFTGGPYNGTTHGYCNNGAPRFNVYSDAGTCFLGCALGDRSQDPNSGWWTIAFKSSHPFNTYPGCESGISGVISGIQIILDEGNDVPGEWGTASPGDVIVDNIRVNLQVAGKPDPY